MGGPWFRKGAVYALGLLVVLNLRCGIMWTSTSLSSSPFSLIYTPILAQLGVGGSDTSFFSMGLDTSANIYISGDEKGVLAGGTQYGTHGTIDALVTKFDHGGNLLWASQLGLGGAQAEGYALTVDSQGNSYVTGYILGGIFAGATMYGATGNHDLYVAKFNSSGSLQWISQLGHPASNIEGLTIMLDTSGNILISAYTTGTGFVNGTQYGAHGTRDFVLVKFDSSGVYQWLSQVGKAATSSWGYILALDSSGNAFVAGTTTATGFVSGTQYGVHGTQDAFVAKFDNTGAYQWLSQIGLGGANTGAGGIVLDSTGNVFVSGTTTGTGFVSGTQYGVHGTSDVMLAKFNSAGVYQWLKEVGVAGATANNGGISADPAGNLFVYFSTSGTGYMNGTQYGVHGASDGGLMKFDNTGAYQWLSQRGVAGASITTCQGGRDITGHFYMCGQTDTYLGGIQYGTHGTHDGLLLSSDGNGVIP